MSRHASRSAVIGGRPRWPFGSRIRRAGAGLDRGLMLMELIVVVSIAGTATGVAIPVYAALKAGSYDVAAASELRLWIDRMEGARFEFGDTFGPTVPMLASGAGSPDGHAHAFQSVGISPLVPTFGQYFGYIYDDRTNHLYCFSSVHEFVHQIDTGDGLAADKAACIL